MADLNFKFFTLRCLPVNALPDVGERVLVVLLDQTFGLLLEVLDGVIAPPFVQVAVLVEQPAFVVEAMRQLMPDDDADPAVVQTLREVTVIERRLQNPRREHDLVLAARVERVDDRRVSLPQRLVDRLANFLLLLAAQELQHVQRVFEELFRMDVKLRVLLVECVVRKDEVGIALKNFFYSPASLFIFIQNLPNLQ